MTDQPVTDEPVDRPDRRTCRTRRTCQPTTPDGAVAPVESAERSNQLAAPTATAVLTHIVRSIVDDADAVQGRRCRGSQPLKLEVKVGPGDLGRVIGRRGRTAQSIRTVVRAAATRDGVEVDVDFVD